MTQVQRAKATLDKINQARAESNGFDEGMRFIEQAIMAAVEETRAEEARESLLIVDRAVTVAAEAAREEERAICEKILDEEHAAYLKRGFAPEECFVNAIERIRARSESPIEPPEKQ